MLTVRRGRQVWKAELGAGTETVCFLLKPAPSSARPATAVPYTRWQQRVWRMTLD